MNCQDVLTRAFAEEVVPRLLSARRKETLWTEPVVNAGQVDHLVGLVLDGTQQTVTAYVAALRDGGVPADSLLLHLLTPVARRLGQMWDDDDCSFSDVTVGLGRLAHVMRELTQDCDRTAPLQSGPSALLVQVPGEQHGFGLAMVVHFFRQGGWHVRQAPLATSAELVGLVRKDWFGIVGVSVACSSRLETLASDIIAIRKHSRNANIGIMVGGPPFVAHPQLAALVGADATAMDGQQALREAHRLVGARADSR